MNWGIAEALQHKKSLAALALLVTGLLSFPALYFNQLPLLAVAIVGVLGFLAFFSQPFAALVLFTVFIPFEELIVLPYLGTPTRLAGILFFASYLVHRRFDIRLGVFPIAAWLWFFWAFASLSWSQEPRFTGFFQLTQLIFMAWLVADFVARDKTIVAKLLQWYTASASILASLGLFNFLQNADSNSFSQQTRTSGFEGQGVEHFAFYLIPALFTSLYYTLNAKSLLKRLVCAGLSVLFLLAILASGTRGAWLSVTAGLAIAYLPKLRLQQWLALIVVTVIGFGAISQVPAVTEFVRFRADSALDSGGAGRVNIWQVSTVVFARQPIQGVGFRNYEHTVRLQDFDAAPFNITYTDGFREQVLHNIYLEVLVELGLIGFVLWMLWLSRLVFCRSNDPEWFLLYGILIAYLVGGLTNPELNRKYFWITIGMAEGLRYAYYQAKTRLQA